MKCRSTNEVYSRIFLPKWAKHVLQSFNFQRYKDFDSCCVALTFGCTAHRLIIRWSSVQPCSTCGWNSILFLLFLVSWTDLCVPCMPQPDAWRHQSSQNHRVMNSYLQPCNRTHTLQLKLTTIETVMAVAASVMRRNRTWHAGRRRTDQSRTVNNTSSVESDHSCAWSI